MGVKEKLTTTYEALDRIVVKIIIRGRDLISSPNSVLSQWGGQYLAASLIERDWPFTHAIKLEDQPQHLVGAPLLDC